MKKLCCAIPTNPLWRGTAGAWEPDIYETEDGESLTTEDGESLEVDE